MRRPRSTLGAADEALLHDPAQGGVGNLGRLADPADLVGVLDRAQALHRVSARDQLDPVSDQFAQAAVGAHAHVGVLEGQPQLAGGQQLGH